MTMPYVPWPVLLLAVAFAFGAPTTRAQTGADPLHSRVCRKAVQALDAQEQSLQAASAPHGTQALNNARRRAAVACLGHGDGKGVLPQHVAVPPVSVAPVAVPPAAAPRPITPATPARPAPGVAALPTVTSCDAAGCWASDGTRLLRNGPDLIGPRGLCSLVGGVLRCP